MLPRLSRGLFPGGRQSDTESTRLLTVTGAVVAVDATFRFASPFGGLEVVERAATPIGWNAAQPVVTPYDECVLVMPSTRQARAGVTLVRFAYRQRL